LCFCRRHHRLVHEAGYGLTTPRPGVFVFTRPDGQLIPDVARVKPAAGPSLQERNRDEGLTIEPGTCRSLGEGENFDLDMTLDAVLYPELRRRGRSWGVPRRPAPPVHERLVQAVPEFALLLDEHIADFEEVLPHTLFETFSSFVLDAHRAGHQPLVSRCLNFLDAALSSDDGDDDDEAENLVRCFIDTVGPWDPDTHDFVATWPPTLRHRSDALLSS
jgi:hypothetical protein